MCVYRTSSKQDQLGVSKKGRELLYEGVECRLMPVDHADERREEQSRVVEAHDVFFDTADASGVEPGDELVSGGKTYVVTYVHDLCSSGEVTKCRTESK